MWIYGLVMFLLVTLCCILIVGWMLPNRTKQRLQSLSGQTIKTANWEKIIVDIAHPFAKLGTPEGNWEESPLRIKFINAGIRNRNAPILFFASKALLPLLVAGIVFIILQIASTNLPRMQFVTILLVSALIACYLPNVLLENIRERRKRKIFENFPDAADLMLVCVEAGLGMEAAMVRVAEEMQHNCPELAEEIHLTNLETRAGSNRETALRNLALRTGVEEIFIFSAMLTQADKFGTSVGESLRVFSEDLRHKREMKAEELAAKIPVKLTVPTVLCIFPATLMVMLVPAFLSISAAFSGLVGK